MRIILLGLAAALVIVKDLAIVWAAGAKFAVGGRLAERLRNGDGAELEHFPALVNPFDRLLMRVAGGSSVWARLVRLSFTAPAVVVSGAVVAFACSHEDQPVLTLTLGIGLATCSALVVLTAVIRRMLFGADDWKTSDVQVPAGGLFGGWAMAREKGANKSVYFLVIVYLSVLGFAALYLAIGVTEPSAFVGAGDGASRITWLYFSLTTLATVGYGDIHPESTGAMIAVSSQIAAGALLLSWLLAAFLSSPAVDEGASDDALRKATDPLDAPPEGNAASLGEALGDMRQDEVGANAKDSPRCSS